MQKSLSRRLARALGWVRHYYAELFATIPSGVNAAARAASMTWELSEFLVDGLELPSVAWR